MRMRLATMLLLALLSFASPWPTLATPSPLPGPALPSPSVPSSPSPQADAALRAKAAEYRALRLVKGHFSGGPWNDAVDKWGGPKHALMGDLQQALGDGRHTEAQVGSLMGPPDEVLGPDSIYCQRQRDLPRGASRMLVYWWRGRHDFLFFVCVGDRVVLARWFMALE